MSAALLFTPVCLTNIRWHFELVIVGLSSEFYSGHGSTSITLLNSVKLVQRLMESNDDLPRLCHPDTGLNAVSCPLKEDLNLRP